jgi:periplasmic protein CpxP/Spy
MKNMKKRLMIWVLGGLIAVSAVGMSFGAKVVSAADQGKQSQMMQGNQGMMQDPKAMADMMKSPDMQKQCLELMKNPEMQKAMIDMMKQPEMQAAMKQMLQRDMKFHQMMLDLVNSVDMNMDHAQSDSQMMPGDSMPGMDHSAHH